MVPGPYELTVSQGKIGNKITYICGKNESHDCIINDSIDLIKIGPKRSFVSGGIFSISGIRALIKIIKIEKKFDIIHGHGHLPFYYHIYRTFMKGKTPYVYHMHITSAGRKSMKNHYSLRTKIQGFFLWPIMILCEKIGCSVAEKIIAVSESVKNEIIHYYSIDARKIEIIENGVSLKNYNLVIKTDTPQIMKNMNNHYLLYVGVLSRRKNISNIIKTMNFLPDQFILTIIGEGEERFELNNLIDKYNLNKRVHLLGEISYEKIHNYYLSSDAFILLSFYEGLPKVILEALSAQLQIFTTKSFNISTTLGKYINWLDSDDPKFVAEYIENKFMKGKTKIPGDIMNKISWDNKALEIQNIYNSIL